MICEKDAIPGHDPNPTEYPPVVPNEKCESEWFYMESTGNCYHIDHYMVNSFDASEANCVGKGGHLASINSPEAQAEIRIHLNDPTATGKIFRKKSKIFLIKTAKIDVFAENVKNDKLFHSRKIPLNQ